MSKKVVTDSPKDKSVVSLSHQSKKQRMETPLQKKKSKKKINGCLVILLN